MQSGHTVVTEGERVVWHQAAKVQHQQRRSLIPYLLYCSSRNKQKKQKKQDKQDKQTRR